MLKLRSNKYKDILIEGKVSRLGEYSTAPILDRNRAGVSIVDNDGETLHFAGLEMPKTLDDKIRPGEQVSMKILRFRFNDHNLGFLYAVKPEKEGKWFTDTNLKTKLGEFLFYGYKRFRVLRLAGCIMFGIFGAPVLWLAFWAAMGFSNGGWAALAGTVISISLFWWPVMFAGKTARVSEHLEGLIDEGAVNLSAAIDKY